MANTPERSHLVIRGAHVLTMDPGLGDIRRGDVHIDGGEIVAVGQGLSAPGAEEIDGAGMIVMPGLIDAHTHLWTSQMRGCFGDRPETTYFRTRNRLGDRYTPEDIYCGTLLGAAESIHSGITTTVDFFHNNRGADFVDAGLRALKESAIRCRFLFGASTRSLPDEPVDLASFERLAGAWPGIAGDLPLSFGLAWRGPLGITTVIKSELKAPDAGVAKEEFDTARRLGLPLAVHVSGITAKAHFEALRDGGYLGPDLQLVHFSNATAEDIRIAAELGASVALTPLTELRVGYGITQLGDYLAGDIRVGFGVDSSSLGGAADMFAVLKLFQLIETGRLKNELAITARRLLECATIEGARALGMDDKIGSIAPGKRADIIMIDATALNMGLFADDPAHLLVEAAQPANVDTVIVDGRVLKRAGRMTALNPARVIEAAQRSAARMRDVLAR